MDRMDGWMDKYKFRAERVKQEVRESIIEETLWKEMHIVCRQ